jgi:hypothetical protein
VPPLGHIDASLGTGKYRIEPFGGLWGGAYGMVVTQIGRQAVRRRGLGRARTPASATWLHQSVAGTNNAPSRGL